MSLLNQLHTNALKKTRGNEIQRAIYFGAKKLKPEVQLFHNIHFPLILRRFLICTNLKKMFAPT